MNTALGDAQTIVLLGGNSDIGRAIVRRLVTATTRTLVLAVRDPESASVEEFERPGLTVDVVAFDGANLDDHGDFVDDLAARHGDLDVVVLAFATLAPQDELDDDPAAVAHVAVVNFAGAVGVGTAVARQFRRQGHGRLVVLSSVAGERVRKSNMVYGSTKAGLDGWAQGLADSLVGSGASVLIVRPGFIHTTMTEGVEPTPLAASADDVAVATVKALRSGRRVIWVPGILRFMFIVFRHLPAPLWRRMPR